MANCSSDVSNMHDEFFELLWDNGPVVMQGPSKNSFHTDGNNVCRVQDKDSKVSIYPPVKQTDEVNPWNYPMEDSIGNVNCSEYLFDYSGVDLNSTTDSQMNDAKRRWSNPTIREEQGGKNQPFLSYVASTKSRIADTGMGSSNVSSPFALGKAKLQNVDKMESNEKATRNLMESLLNESSIALCQKDTSVKNNQCTTGNCSRSPNQIQSSSFAASVALECHGTDKVQEAVVASSVNLGSSSEPASNNHRQREKRKRREIEESGYLSEDVEDELVRLKKPSTLQRRSTKRNRAAEVHNLSERRRRDRINEKMRALQELIPNCNKTCKASMLDEAIEYLKTLQMQVQIMSIGGGGLCMHPMMMQHIRVPTMAHFSPMGMGVGFGYGSPFVPIYGPRFPCSSIPGMLKPGQGFPMSMVHGQPVNFLSGTITTPPIPSVSSKEQKQQTSSLEKIQKPNAGDY